MLMQQSETVKFFRERIIIHMRRKIFFVIATLTFACTSGTSHAASTSLFNAQVLLQGMTQSIEIRQDQLLPLGCPHFFILTVGSGMLGISLKKDDVAGDGLFMVGFVSAGGKITPVTRIGTSKGMIDQIIEIKGEANTLGFAWVWCGVTYSQNTPIYKSELRLSLEP
jgi:hypothetical protein